jgi:hypothetical protein
MRRNIPTIENASRELESVTNASLLKQETRTAAQWAELIVRELRQQLGVDWSASMEDLYEATVNLRERSN